VLSLSRVLEVTPRHYISLSPTSPQLITGTQSGLPVQLTISSITFPYHWNLQNLSATYINLIVHDTVSAAGKIMAPKRKHEEPAVITYGSDAPWLRTIFDPPEYQRTEALDSNKSGRDPALPAFANHEVIVEMSKLLYLLYHQIKFKNVTLRHFGLELGSNEHVALTKQLNLKQSQWKGAILNKFFLPHVQELQRRWLVANAWRSFTSLPAEERQQIWLNAYDEDPILMTISMFKPVVDVLDIFNTFNLNVAEEDMGKMRAVRIMLRNKYLFGCETTYEHRIKTEKKVRGLCANGKATANAPRILVPETGWLILGTINLNLPSSRSQIYQSLPGSSP
jgi:hypothetical protein